MSVSCNAQERNARLIGGLDSLFQAIKHETILSNSCSNSGNVFVEYRITTSGTTEDIEVVKGICQEADSIAINIIARLKYIPAVRNGNTISIKQTLRIPFQIE